MSYDQLIQRDIPYAYYNLDAAGSTRPPLVWAGGGSSLITNQSVTYNFPVFTNRQQTFAIEVWFKPIDSQPVNILGHSEGDGLKWSDNKVTYEYWIGSQKIVLSKYVKTLSVIQAVIVYDITSIGLYINGEPADSYLFTNEERNTSYYAFSTPDTLITSGNTGIVVDAVSFYSQILPDAIKRHYEFAQPNTFIIGNAAMQSAETFELNINNLVSKEVVPDLYQSSVENVSITNGTLSQSYDNDGGILAGSWVALVNTDGIQNTLVDYKSTGAVSLSYSYDGNTWAPTTNYVNTPSQSYFLLKITFDTSKAIVSDLKFYQYKNQTISSHGGMRQTSISNQPVFIDYFYPTIGKDDGVKGSLTISGSGTAQTVEFWIKATSDSNLTSLSGTKIVNGGSGWFANEWNHVVINGSVPNSFTVGNSNSKVSIINIYVNQPDTSSLYLSYFGRNKINIGDTSVVTIVDNIKEYSYKWSIITG